MSMSHKMLFLSSVLGTEGASALLKAADKSSGLNRVLVPRTILAWMNLSDEFTEIPGIGVPLTLKKQEDGSYSGSVVLGTGPYAFDRVTQYHVAAAIALAIGMEEVGGKRIRDVRVERLGKNIDALAKAYKNRITSSVADIRKRASLSKREASGTGTTAKPKAPDMPQAPSSKAPAANVTSAPGAGPTKAPAGTPKPPKPKASHTLKLSEKESKLACGICGIPQFQKKEFAGCICLRDLKKGATTHRVDGGFVVKLRPDIDLESIVTLLESVRGSDE